MKPTEQIDLNTYLLHNNHNTSILRMQGHTMSGAGIFPGDLLIVDRSAIPSNTQIVVASLFGDLLVRRYEKKSGKVRLLPESEQLAPIEVDLANEECYVWGVVTHAIRQL